MSDTRRHHLLCALLQHDPDVAAVYVELASLPWDCPDPLVTLGPRHVAAVLGRFLTGELSAESVERWANAIESREDIRVDSLHEDALRRVIFDLANPELAGALGIDSAHALLRTLHELSR